MRRSPLHQSWPLFGVLLLGMVLVLAACAPEETPASTARTAAALRTPAAASGQSTQAPPPTLAAGGQRGTPQLAGATAPAQAPVAPLPTPTPAPASLSASPNPIAAEPGQLATTTISWNTGVPEDGRVYVSENGEPEKLFAAGPSGSQEAPWIKFGHSYEFRLYPGTSRDKSLASLTVGKPAAAIDLRAEPNPVPANDEELGSTMVSWSTDNGGTIFVAEDGGPEALFASGVRGAELASWICRGTSYEFRLYAGSEHSNPLKTLVVTRAQDAPDHAPPPRVECNQSETD